MEAFSRTFLPASGEAGIPIHTVSRHMPVFRRCVDPRDPVVMVTRCLRPERPLRGEHLLLLTRGRLVVTQETRLLSRIRLHLNAPLRELSHVVWTAEPRLAAIELAATASDGLRERFWIKLGDPHRMWQVDALLAHAFRPAPRVVRAPVTAAQPAPVAAYHADPAEYFLASPPIRIARPPARHAA